MPWDKVERRKNCSGSCPQYSEIKDIHHAIFGNGNGVESGLQWKVASNTEFIDYVKKVFGIVVTIALTGALSAVGLFVLTVVRMAHGKLGGM